MSAPVMLGNAAAIVSSQSLSRRPQTVAEAAQQFEALLVAQLLKSARGEDNGWMGTGEDTGNATAAGLAEEQFAQALAQNGGLGLSAPIVSSLSGGAK